MGGRTVLEWTLFAFRGLPGVQAMVLAISAEDGHWPELEFSGKQDVRVAPGGAERAWSVLNALDSLADEARPEDFVLVHDAARPCLSQAALARLVGSLADHPVGGLLAVPVADTLKEADSKGEVVATRDRAGLWQAQTPQMFRFGLLRDALRGALGDDVAAVGVTDESSAMEAAGHRPLLVPGELQNLKITRAGDLALAARILGVEEEN